MVVLLRWLLIIATSYVLIFSHRAGELSPSVGLFVAAYLASNIVLPVLLPRLRPRRLAEMAIVLFDIAAVSVGLALAGSGATGVFLVYFLVVFVAALSERPLMAVGAAMLISIVHLATVSQFIPLHQLIDSGYALRFPFLFAVALFLSFEVAQQRARERQTRARERDRRRTEILSSIIHDIKNPLASIQTLSEMLLEGDPEPLTSGQSDLVRRIHADVRRVIQLSVNLLEASRINSGRFMLHRRAANFGDIVADAIAGASSAAELKGISLTSSQHTKLPLWVFDPLQMERVVSNLVDNAIKYTPAGGSVAVETWSELGDIVLRVKDTGNGMASEEIPALFQRFRRHADTSAIEGMGLGLFIVKAIVEAHGGTLQVTSGIGQGTAITVRLPRRQEAASAAAATVAHAAVGSVLVQGGNRFGALS